MDKQTLAKYAIIDLKSKGRRQPEEDHLYRSLFQRDRERIIHSSSFRRLEYKTQVFLYHEGDYYRTRLTHTIEVSQIARTIARALNLNEDLVEAIALAHDLGHSPFGHAGEKILNELMEGHGGFEHNQQGLRIVDFLEQRYPSFRGLNLTFETREGIARHSARTDLLPNSEFSQNRWPSIEAQVVCLADEIAYNSHDLDDGITSEMLNTSDLAQIKLWKENFLNIKNTCPGIDFKILKYQTIKMIINNQVTDLIENTLKNITSQKINSDNMARHAEKPLVAFSENMDRQHLELKKFLFVNLYNHYRIIRMENKARKFIGELFKTYLSKIELLPPSVQRELENEKMERVICDYISGMTDRFALEEYKKLFDPNEKV